jgi:hypothetical protein
MRSPLLQNSFWRRWKAVTRRRGNNTTKNTKSIKRANDLPILPGYLVPCTGMNGIPLSPLSLGFVSRFVIPAKARKARREPGSRKNQTIL